MTKRGRGRPRRAGADAEILGVVLEMLRERGYRDLTVDAVAERAGVAKTTVYRRWPSKGALVAAALVPDNLPPAAPDSGSLREDLIFILRDTCARLRPLAQSHPDADLVEVMLAVLAPRRALLEEVIARSERSSDQKVLTELLLGALLVRLLVTGDPLDDDCATAVVSALLRDF